MTTEVVFEGEDIPQDKLPIALGWRILIAPIKVQEKTSGGIILTSSEVEGQKHMRFVGKIVAMGPLCYTRDDHKEDPRASVKPWCKVGDIISTSQYAGATLPCKHNGEEFYLRVVNDEEIVTRIPDVSVLNI